MRPRKTGAVVLAAITIACGGDGTNGGTGPATETVNPGFVNVTLATPNSNDGALLLTLSGGTMDSLTASAGTIFFASTGTNTFRIMVAGTIVDGPIVRFWMPDRRNVAQYLATLEQAAVRTTYEQQDIGAYSLSIAE